MTLFRIPSRNAAHSIPRDLVYLASLFLLFLVAPSLAKAAGSEGAPHYVGSAVCASCHKAETTAWQTSHHARAWMDPGPDTVDGDFNDVTFAHKGRTTRFFTKDGDYFIETDDVPGDPQTFKVMGVDGYQPLQQYLVETEPGRLQSFDVVWDQDRKRWYHLYEDQTLMPDDGLHWTGPYKNWNGRCAECHATGYSKNYDLKTRHYSSTQSEIGVGCEACHGPGEAHISWAENHDGADDALPQSPFPGMSDTGLLIDYLKGNAETEIQQCAGCHSRREAFQDGNPLPGTPFHDAYRLSLLRPGLYHADGQIQDEVYVYGSFLQSKMYSKGVRCSNCHEPHSGALHADGNAVCTQCHSPAGNDAFPSLTKKLYDDPSHHFHQAGTAGAECKSCHMIERTYMGIDGRRDHSFRIPRPDLSATLGTPNACNDCHREKSAEWAATELETRFPNSTHRGFHFGQVFAPAQQPGEVAPEDLLAIANQDSFPGIVRASALDLLAPLGTPDVASAAAPLIEDPDPLVRAAALTLQRSVPGPDKVQRIVTGLQDPVKSVRIAAAREFLTLRIAHMPDRIAKAADDASRDWQEANAAKLDFPETHMVLAGTALVMRKPDAALSAFQEVTRLDPQMVNAWIMQVRIFMAIGNMAGAQTALQKALVANPGDPNLEAFRTQLQ